MTGEVRGEVRDGTHQLDLTVVNGSAWSVTELRVRVDFTDHHSASKEYVLRSRGTIGPGQTETLSALLDGTSAYGHPPTWRFQSATGYPPES